MRSVALSILLVFVAIALLGVVLRGIPQKREYDKQVKDTEQKIRALKKEESRLKEMSDYFKSEAYLEKQARIRLNLKKEGEKVVFIYKKGENDKISSESGNIKKEENGFIDKIKKLIKDIFK